MSASRFTLNFSAVFICFILSACSPTNQRTVLSGHSQTSTGRVTGALLNAPAAEQYKTAVGVKFQQPAAFPENPLPIYPVELLSQRLAPIAVTVRIVVDERGHVARADILNVLSDSQRLFVAATKSAVAQWKFIPLVQITPAPGTSSLPAPDGDTFEYDGKAKALAFHQDYSFTFSQTNGKPSVNASPAPTSK